MGPLSNSQQNVTKPRARFSAPLEAPRDLPRSRTAVPAAVPPDPISWWRNTSVGTPQTLPGPSWARSCGAWTLSSQKAREMLFAPWGSQDGCIGCLVIGVDCFFFFFFEECFLLPRICLKEPWDSGGWRSRHQCHPSGWRQEDPGSEARAAQGRTPRPAGSYMTRNKGHLALSRGIKLMSKAPETTLPSHRQPWQRKKALTSK